MMEMTTTPAPVEEPARYDVGSKSDNPCWRAATEWRWPEDEHPNLCTEHARWLNLGEEEDAWQYALDAIEEWLRGPVNEDDYGHLERLAINMRDDVRREYANTSARTYAARLAARQGPPVEGEPRLTLEQSEELARLIVRADSFVNTRTTLRMPPRRSWGTTTVG